MANPDEAEALSNDPVELNREVIGEENEKERLKRLVILACSTVPACDMAAVTVVRDGQPFTDVCSDDATKHIDAAQYAATAGPCLDAYRRHQTYRIASTRTDPRWPEFARAAREHGIYSTLSLPLFAGARAVGALNLYSRKERAFEEDDEELAHGLADQASVVLANADLSKKP